MSQSSNNDKAKSAKENIQVYFRLRPLNEAEVNNGDQKIWEVDENSVRINPQVYEEAPNKSFVLFSNKQYSYNQCYNEKVGNTEIYGGAIKPIVLSSLDGINGTVFMYGQTGSGKTYTMLGDYSKEIREANCLGKRSGSSKMRMRSNSRNNYNSASGLKRNSSVGCLSNKINFGNSGKTSTPLQKHNSSGPGLPPKASTAREAREVQDTSQTNIQSFKDYIKNCKQYNITPRKGTGTLTRNKSDGKLHTTSTIQFDESSNKGVLVHALKELFSQIDKSRA